jgi:hypothetical protein
VPDADRDAVDGRHQGLLRRRDRLEKVEGRARGPSRCGREEILQVVSGRERSAHAVDHDRPHGGVRLRRAQRVSHGLIHRPRDRVLLLGTIHADAERRLLALDRHVRHGPFFPKHHAAMPRPDEFMPNMIVPTIEHVASSLENTASPAPVLGR